MRRDDHRTRLRPSLSIGVIVLALLGACSSDANGPSANAGADATTSTAAGTNTTAAPAETLRILVTNDDGVTADGIDSLVAALETLPDVEVLVVAPMENQSGVGGQVTAGPLTTNEAETASGHPAHAVEGFPADAIRAAFDDLGLDPDLVISGTNSTQNLGPLVDLSGAVGAARAAASRAVPALAVSSGVGGQEFDFALADTFALEWVEDHRESALAGDATGKVDNLNVPTCTAGEVRGLVEVAAASEGADQSLLPQDCTSTATGQTDDVQAFNAGFATLTEGLRPAG